MTKEAPQHFACEAVVFWVIMMGAAAPLLHAANARPGIDPLEPRSVIRFEWRKLELAGDALVR